MGLEQQKLGIAAIACFDPRYDIWILHCQNQRYRGPETLVISATSPTRTGSGVGGVDPTFLIMYEHKRGVNPLTFCQKCMGTRGGGTRQIGACLGAR
jgi:hypothetical protein